MFTENQKHLLDKLCEIDAIDTEIRSVLAKTNRNIDEIKKVQHAVKRIIEEKTKGFPWLADAIAQYFEVRDLKISEFLQRKLRPALSSADRVREIAKEKRVLRKQFTITRNLIKYYEALFPWLPEFVGEDLDELIEQVGRKEEKEDTKDDPVRFYLTKGEYQKLSTTERNQRALDRYWSRKKSSWQIGRDYERYIGYLYESKGYAVYYQGIVEGLEDLGRDLIAKKGKEIEVIQCKYWAKYRTIHEKQICQLFGTTLKYWVENQKRLREELKIQEDLFPALIQRKKINGVFITSTSLSERACEFAKELGIVVREQFPLQKYPSIKCNVSRRTGEKIYHLPFDQQYDRTIVEAERNESYVETVAEAEQLGFRRAFRWRGNKEEKA
ncbi:MAG: restriction endonuclease [Deltaproteobacteria bacterium]|nr:restriction endonuclease [Deltaproteobacteria bacterium]